jgi:hypothetical protein
MRVGYALGICLAFAVIVGVLAGTGYAAWWAAGWLLPEVAKLYREASTEFRLGLITAVLSTAGVVWSVIYQRRKELDALRFERKREAYNGFFDMLFDFMKAADTGADPTSDAIFKDKWREITKNMMIWASPGSINAFNKFQVESLRPSDDMKVTFGRMEKLLRQFRADLGHRDTWLRPFGLTKLILRGEEHSKLDA